MKTKAKQPLLTTTPGKLRWQHPDEVAQAIAELKALGYSELSPVQTPLLGCVQMLAFASTKHKAYAILHDEAQSVWVDFFSVELKRAPTCFAATNAEAPLIGVVAQRPTYFISHQLPKVSATVLHKEFLARRPKKEWAVPSLKDLPAAYQIVCEADFNWQKQHLKGKTSEAVMQRVVDAAYKRAWEVQRRNPVGELLLLLRDMRAPDRPRPPVSLTDAAMRGDIEAMKLFLEAGADINEESGYISPLAAAALRGQLDAVNFLLERGADPAKGSFAALSAIAKAARGGYYEIVERLLAAGVPEEQRIAALEQAKREKQEAIVRLLEGRPVPAKLRAKGRAEPREPSFGEMMAEMTLLMGREPESQPLVGKAREEAAARAFELLRLPEVRAAVNVAHKGYGTYLDLAVQTELAPLVQAVIEAGSSAKTISEALITAAERGARELVELLLKAGADPKYEAGPGYTALLAAAQRGDLEIVRRLIEAGADPRARTEGGETPMTAATGPYQKQIREILKQAARAETQRTGTAISTRGKLRKDFVTARGADQFKKAIGHPDWSLVFIEAHPRDVAEAFAKLHPEARWYADTAQARLTAKPPVVMIFRLRGHAWTILLRTVGWLRMEDLDAVLADARLLSAALETRALAYMSEHISGCEGYELFEKGSSIESAEWMGKVEFKSTWRKKPKFGDDFPEPTFSELGIYLPECWIDHDGYETKLVLGGIGAQAVERLDCFELKPA